MIALIAIWIDERDRTFAVVGFIVLAILSASIWWGAYVSGLEWRLLRYQP